MLWLAGSYRGSAALSTRKLAIAAAARVPGVKEPSWQSHMPQVPVMAGEVVASRRRSGLVLLLQGTGQGSWGHSMVLRMVMETATLHCLQEDLIGVLPLQVAAGLI